VAKTLHLDLQARPHASVEELMADLEQMSELVFWQLHQRGVALADVENAATRAAYAAWLEQRRAGDGPPST
jgi:hypothetical protein